MQFAMYDLTQDNLDNVSYSLMSLHWVGDS